jgi:hypothetical protein
VVEAGENKADSKKTDQRGENRAVKMRKQAQGSVAVTRALDSSNKMAMKPKMASAKIEDAVANND